MDEQVARIAQMESTSNRDNKSHPIPVHLKKIVVIGSSCSGKSTFSKAVASALKIQHVELDALNWEANWKEAPAEIFRERIEKALTTDGWIVDGSYSKVRDLVWPNAELVIWLDMPLTTILRRFIFRSFRRTFKKEILWSGNQESLRNSIFQKNSLLMWILKTHKRRRASYLEYLASPPYPQLQVIQLKTPEEVRLFIENFEKK
jgi:adenylate kinase family enzyme